MKFLKGILLTVAILNILEAINVFINQNAATQFGFQVGYLVHSIFHLVIGLFFILVCSKGSPATKKKLKIPVGIAGLILLGNGITILSLKLEAVKFDYHIHYLLHGTYYLIVAAVLLRIAYSLSKGKF